MADIEKFFQKKEEETPKKSPRTNKARKWLGLKNVLIFSVAVLLIGSLGFTFYFYRQWKKAADPETAAKQELAATIKKIGSFIELPKDEEPTLATVKDVGKLKDQPFFANAKDGDVALIYSKSGKAILYRPSGNKIIEVMSLYQNQKSETAGTQNQTQTQSGSAEPQNESQASQAESTPQAEGVAMEVKSAKVAVYNGTNIKGLAQSITDKISGIQGIEIGNKTNAKGNYEKTMVIDLSGDNSEAVSKIIEAIGGEAGELPQGEIKPDADILVIGGKQ